MKWSEPEAIEVKWEGGISDWGYQGVIRLQTPGNRPYVAFLEVVE
jgi:hypothetical protein